MKKVMNYRNIGLVFGLFVLVIIAFLLTPAMFSGQAIIGMLKNNAVYIFLSIGMMFVILTGGIDLSIGATLALVAVIVTTFQCNDMANGSPIPAIVWVIVAIICGVICGAINGVLVGYLKMVPMIATLGTMYIYRGLAYLVSGGKWWFPHLIADPFKAWASKEIIGIPSILWIGAIVFLLAAWFLGTRTTGRRIYAIGTSVESSKIAGINEPFVRFIAFVVSGALAGLAGMLYVANYAACTYSIGDGYELTAVAICILGGVNITGGRGTVDGVFIAWLIMSIITQFIAMLPGLSVWQHALQGAIIIIAVFINIAMNHSRDRQYLKEREALL